MDSNTRKFAVLNLALALIVLALLGLAPLIIDGGHTNSGMLHTGSDLDNKRMFTNGGET